MNDKEQKHAGAVCLPWERSGAMPTLCSRASASLLFLSRSESSWPPEDPPPASAPRFESPYRVQDKLKTWQQPGRFFRCFMKLEVCEVTVFYHLHPSFSSPLLFSSSPLESGRSVVSSSPVQPLAHSCQTYCRRKRRHHRTMKRLFKKYFTHCSMSYFISFIYFTHHKPP